MTPDRRLVAALRSALEEQGDASKAPAMQAYMKSVLPYRGVASPGHLVVTGAWWDHVDALATRTIGPLVRAYPAELVPSMLTWSTDDDMWRRRTAIIHQVGAKMATDTDLLDRCIQPSRPSKEFFLRKAIGWALRDLAWHQPAWVQAYVRAHEHELPGLSRCAALKNCGPGRAGASTGVTGE